MICSSCQFQNPEGEVACQKCGAVLMVPKPSESLQNQAAVIPQTPGGESATLTPTVLYSKKTVREWTLPHLPKVFWILFTVALAIVVVAFAVMMVANISNKSPIQRTTQPVNISSISPTLGNSPDSDNDGVPDTVEAAIGTNPNYQECSEFLTNPCGLITASVSGSEAAKNVLIILDASGSMAEKIGAKSKMDIAKGVLGDYLKTLMDKGFKVGLMVYGHKGSNSAKDKPASCAGIETILPIGSSRDAISAALAGFSPTGWTPIGGSLTQAKDVLAGFIGQDNYVLLVSDGEETCGGDPVAAARSLKQSDVKAVVDVIGFNVDTKTRTQLESVAASGGGKFIFSADEAGFRQATAQVQAGILTARSGFDAGICVAQEKHKLLACLYDFYYTKAQPKITGLKERNALTEKYRQMEKKFDDLTAPFIQKARETLREGVKQIDEGQSGR